MKHYPIQLMDHNFCLLSADKSKQILEQKNFKTVKLVGEHYSILVKIKDLVEIKSTTQLYILDETGTEISNSDIQDIMTTEHICCE